MFLPMVCRADAWEPRRVDYGRHSRARLAFDDYVPDARSTLQGVPQAPDPEEREQGLLQGYACSAFSRTTLTTGNLTSRDEAGLPPWWPPDRRAR